MCDECFPAKKYSTICPHCGKYHPPMEIVWNLSSEQLRELEELTKSFRETRYELSKTPKNDPLHDKLFEVACRLLQDRINIILEA